MKPSFLSRFTRSTGCAPAGWPTDDVAEIDASANELKKITADILKKLSSYFPPPSSSTLQPLDLASFSFDSLQLFGSCGDRLLNRAAELEGTHQKHFTTHNSHQTESNGFSTCSSDTRSQEHELNAEGGSRSYGDSSSKETPKNGESTETRFFTSGNTMPSSCPNSSPTHSLATLSHPIIVLTGGLLINSYALARAFACMHAFLRGCLSALVHAYSSRAKDNAGPSPNAFSV